MRVPPSALILLSAVASLAASSASFAEAEFEAEVASLQRGPAGGLRRRRLNPGKRPGAKDRDEERKEKFDKLLAEMEEIESEIKDLKTEFSEDDPDEDSSSWEDREIGGAEERDEADGLDGESEQERYKNGEVVGHLEEPEEMKKEEEKTQTTLEREEDEHEDKDENDQVVGGLGDPPQTQTQPQQEGDGDESQQQEEESDTETELMDEIAEDEDEVRDELNDLAQDVEEQPQPQQEGDKDESQQEEETEADTETELLDEIEEDEDEVRDELNDLADDIEELKGEIEDANEKKAEEDEDEDEDEAEKKGEDEAVQVLDVEGYDMLSRPSSEGQDADEDEDAALETEEADNGETVTDGPNEVAGPRTVPHRLPGAVEHFHMKAHQVLDGDMRTEKETTHYKWSLGKPKGP